MPQWQVVFFSLSFPFRALPVSSHRCRTVPFCVPLHRSDTFEGAPSLWRVYLSLFFYFSWPWILKPIFTFGGHIGSTQGPAGGAPETN